MKYSIQALTFSLACLAILCSSFNQNTFAQGGSGLSSLATVTERLSHRASSYDRTGDNNDNIHPLAPGETKVLLDTDGPGKLTHFWFTMSGFQNHPMMMRDVVIRIYWEGSKVPSVEVPLGDFFGLGHGLSYRVHSAPINVGSNSKALNCYWPMPFYKHAKIEITNTGERSIRRIYYNIDYELGPIPPKQGLFHAEFKRTPKLLPQKMIANHHGKENYVLLDTKGEGQYVGCFLFVDSAPGGWWGEGDEMIFIDGEEKPSIIGTGTEDYFGNAWGFDGVSNFPFYGTPLLKRLPDGWTQTAVYRLHVPDPVRFKKGIKVTLEHAWHGEKAYDYSSVVYWYQLNPITKRKPLPVGEARQPRKHLSKKKPVVETRTICATQLESHLRKQNVNAKAITTWHRRTVGGGYLLIDSPGKVLDLPVANIAPGTYQVSVRFFDTSDAESIDVRLKGKGIKATFKASAGGLIADLGTFVVKEDGAVVLSLQSTKPISLDYIRLTPVNE